MRNLRDRHRERTDELRSPHLLGAERVRDVLPGELLIVDENGVGSVSPFARAPRKMCIFEYVYFARPDSILEGASVYSVRKAVGAASAPAARERVARGS